MSELLSIGQIKSQWKEIKEHYSPALGAEFIERFQLDERSGVQALIQAAKKEEIAFQKEEERIDSLRFFENKYMAEYPLIGGVDEVGRGPLAGPVITCAVILPANYRLHGINDSKKLSEKKREELFEIIKRDAVAFCIGEKDHQRIDEINILEATYEAMGDSIRGLNPAPDLMLVDAVHIPNIPMRQVDIIKGDAKSITIGAASILAKVTRDHMMEEYDKLYPEYQFAKNKGYGTKDHIEAIQKYGPCPIHRRSFIGNFI